jgi:hypothetical protein
MKYQISIFKKYIFGTLRNLNTRNWRITSFNGPQFLQGKLQNKLCFEFHAQSFIGRIKP